jgi:hypothetical protein
MMPRSLSLRCDAAPPCEGIEEMLRLGLILGSPLTLLHEASLFGLNEGELGGRDIRRCAGHLLPQRYLREAIRCCTESGTSFANLQAASLLRGRPVGEGGHVDFRSEMIGVSEGGVGRLSGMQIMAGGNKRCNSRCLCRFGRHAPRDCLPRCGGTGHEGGNGTLGIALCVKSCCIRADSCNEAR